MLPTSQMRALRELEPPSWTRASPRSNRCRSLASGRVRPSVFVGAPATRAPTSPRHSPRPTRRAPLVFDWCPDGGAGARFGVRPTASRGAVTGPVEVAVCPHPGGPPTCWCRPPLPGLPLAFARSRSLDPARSTLYRLFGRAPHSGGHARRSLYPRLRPRWQPRRCTRRLGERDRQAAGRGRGGDLGDQQC